MKIKKSTKKQTIIILAVAAIVLIGASASAYVFREELGFVQHENVEEINYEEPTESELQGEETAEIEIDLPEEAPAQPEQTNEEQQDAPSSESEHTITISSINQDGSTLQIRTMITPLANDGECKISLGKASETPVQQTAQIQNMPSYSTCQGFNIDTSSLAKGSWNVEVSYTKDGKTSTGRGTATIQ